MLDDEYFFNGNGHLCDVNHTIIAVSENVAGTCVIHINDDFRVDLSNCS
jgi:hypothetical protein